MSNQSKSQQFKTILIGLSELYKFEMSPAVSAMYWAALKQLSADELNRAAQSHISDSDQGRWMPKPAHLLNQIYGNEAQSAWQALCEQLARGGADVGPKTESALTGAGGMYQVRRMSTDQLMGLKRQFISNYCADLAEKPAQIGNDTAKMIE
jgi:hypothetical protein